MHGYQLGASLIAWFVGGALTGSLHQPIDAFYSSQVSLNSNDWPIISLSSGSDLSQTEHVVVPYKWSLPQGGDLKIWVANINDPPSGSSDTGNDDPTNFVTINSTEDSYIFDMHPNKGASGVWFGSLTPAALPAHSLLEAQFTTGHTGRRHLRAHHGWNSADLRWRCSDRPDHR